MSYWHHTYIIIHVCIYACVVQDNYRQACVYTHKWLDCGILKCPMSKLANSCIYFPGMVVNTASGKITIPPTLLMCSVDLPARSLCANMKQYKGKCGCVSWCSIWEATYGSWLASWKLHTTYPFIDCTKCKGSSGDWRSGMWFFENCFFIWRLPINYDCSLENCFAVTITLEMSSVCQCLPYLISQLLSFAISVIYWYYTNRFVVSREHPFFSSMLHSRWFFRPGQSSFMLVRPNLASTAWVCIWGHAPPENFWISASLRAFLVCSCGL